VWQQLATDAADSQDVAHAAQKATAGFFTVAAALGVPVSPLPNQQLPPVYLKGDSEAQAALRRIKERAKAAGADLFELILSGSVADWEAFITISFQAGCGADIQEATAQHQVAIMGTKVHSSYIMMSVLRIMHHSAVTVTACTAAVRLSCKPSSSVPHTRLWQL
jgi:nucleotide-binding universal stress UspA family protein